MMQTDNSFNSGLNLDTNPIAVNNDTLTSCLNGTLITYNGNEFILQNDMGNGKVEYAYLPSGYAPVGMKEHGGIIYVASKNPITGDCQIGSFPSPEQIHEPKDGPDLDEVSIDFSDFITNKSVKTTRVIKRLTDKLRPGDQFAIEVKDTNDTDDTNDDTTLNYNNFPIIFNDYISVNLGVKNENNSISLISSQISNNFNYFSEKTSGELYLIGNLDIPKQFDVISEMPEKVGSGYKIKFKVFCDKLLSGIEISGTYKDSTIFKLTSTNGLESCEGEFAITTEKHIVQIEITPKFTFLTNTPYADVLIPQLTQSITIDIDAVISGIVSLNTWKYNYNEFDQFVNLWYGFSGAYDINKVNLKFYKYIESESNSESSSEFNDIGLIIDLGEKYSYNGQFTDSLKHNSLEPNNLYLVEIQCFKEETIQQTFYRWLWTNNLLNNKQQNFNQQSLTIPIDTKNEVKLHYEYDSVSETQNDNSNNQDFMCQETHTCVVSPEINTIDNVLIPELSTFYIPSIKIAYSVGKCTITNRKEDVDVQENGLDIFDANPKVEITEDNFVKITDYLYFRANSSQASEKCDVYEMSQCSFTNNTLHTISISAGKYNKKNYKTRIFYDGQPIYSHSGYQDAQCIRAFPRLWSLLKEKNHSDQLFLNLTYINDREWDNCKSYLVLNWESWINRTLNYTNNYNIILMKAEDDEYVIFNKYFTDAPKTDAIKNIVNSWYIAQPSASVQEVDSYYIADRSKHALSCSNMEVEADLTITKNISNADEVSGSLTQGILLALNGFLSSQKYEYYINGKTEGSIQKGSIWDKIVKVCKDGVQDDDILNNLINSNNIRFDLQLKQSTEIKSITVRNDQIDKNEFSQKVNSQFFNTPPVLVLDAAKNPIQNIALDQVYQLNNNKYINIDDLTVERNDEKVGIPVVSREVIKNNTMQDISEVYARGFVSTWNRFPFIGEVHADVNNQTAKSYPFSFIYGGITGYSEPYYPNYKYVYRKSNELMNALGGGQTLIPLKTL